MEGIAKLGELLRSLPLWLLAGLCAAGAFVLYAPPMPGLNLTAARAWPWIAPAFILSFFLLIARLGEMAVTLVASRRASTPKPSLQLTIHEQVNTTWWATTVQADGSTTTQICADVTAFNSTKGYVRITAARLIRPHVAAALRLPTVFTLSDPVGGPLHSAKSPVRPRGTSSIRVSLMVRKRLATAGKFLPVVIGLTDQFGYEYRASIRLWPTP